MGVGGETPARLNPLATEFNKSVGANADIIATGITLTQDGILRVTVALDGAAVFKLKLTRDTTEKVLEYNSGSSLAADALYSFDVAVRAGDVVNFRSGSAVTVHVLNVDEIIAMGP